MEIRPIPGALGYYAGSDGNIYSDWVKNGKTRNSELLHTLKPGIQTTGKYYFVNIKFGNKRCTSRVHRLICIAFHGNPPTEKHTASHLDGNWRNNKPENLRWETMTENHRRKKDHNTDDVGYKNSRAKVNKEQLEEIRKYLAQGLTHQSIADKFNVNRVFITKINTGYRYKGQ